MILACGRKIVTGVKKQSNLSISNKSQTLPRNLGSKAVANTSGFRTPNKPTATPPVVRRTIVSNLHVFHSFRILGV